NGHLDGWLSSALGHLALIILTDQFPRNIYRGSPRAFEFDHLARAWCIDGLKEGIDRKLRPVERVFFYLPLEHSEDLNDQSLCVSLFYDLAGAVSPELKRPFSNFVDFALRHQAIIERFGRFPHRNAILGRESTSEEIQFLRQPDSSF